MHKRYLLRLWEGTGKAEGSPSGDGGGGQGTGAPIDYDKINAMIGSAVENALKGFKPPPAAQADGAKPEGEGTKPSGDGTPDKRFEELQRSNEEMKKRLNDSERRGKELEERAERKDRAAAISRVLSEFQFASPDAAQEAHDAFMQKIVRGKDADEKLYAPDGTTPYDQYLREQLEGPRSFFLAPKPIGGTGASAGNGRGGKGVQIEDLKPGASKETLAAADAEIAAILRSLHN